jgi:O-antigen ligase
VPRSRLGSMLANLKSVRNPVEIALLVGLCLTLPLVEAPKNMFWLAYVAAWSMNRLRARDFGGGWDLWDSLIAAWIASGFLVAAFAGLHASEWKGALDLARYGSVLWLVKRGGYGEKEQRWTLGALVVSVVIGLGVGYVRIWSGIGKSGTLQLHSVGHVNHSAIYIAIMLGVCIAWLFARWRAWRFGQRAVATAVTALVFASLLVTASRAAVGVGLVLMLILAAAWWPRSRVPFIASMSVVVVAVVVALVGGAEVVRKQEQVTGEQNVLSYRDGIWHVAGAAWRAHPWFGIGMDNYSRISPEKLRAWDQEGGRAHDPGRYWHTSHAHSLYFNTLAERGTVGSLALAAVLAAWLFCLFRYRPRRDSSDHEWIAWSGAASAWIVTIGAGTANTTLHHEHGLLAALLLGLWLSSLPARRAS